ncbi:hypothetical protein TTRE_0000190301 [Trichuris trichiura]|uniref:Uncharacterized protein n=1 Tax=Trichuris trichiura TaxID=36087 RepID=A0A077Z1V4_TRITR|nr:hypothetical protein TTRE_0000190301 [Trichuris trichiura]
MAISWRILLVMLVIVSSGDADVGPPPKNTTDWYYYGFKVMKDAERWVIDFNLDNPWNMMMAFQVDNSEWSPWGWTGTWTSEPSTPVSKTTVEIRTDPPVTERTTEASSKTSFVPDKWKEEGREQNAKDDNVLIYLSAVVTAGVVTLIVVTAFFSIRRKKLCITPCIYS